MLIDLTIKNLYGKDYNLTFNEDLTILYGLNGSGKTTILNIVYSICTGDIKQVCGYSFDELSFNYLEKNKKRNLKIVKTDNNYRVSLDKTDYIMTELEENINAVYKQSTIDNIDESSDYMNGLINKVGQYKLVSSDKKNLEVQKK